VDLRHKEGYSYFTVYIQLNVIVKPHECEDPGTLRAVASLGEKNTFRCIFSFIVNNYS
jgi:hypothetical protein